MNDHLADNYEFMSTKQIKITSLNNKKTIYNFSFYLLNDEVINNLSWDWIFDEFDLEKISVNSRPKAILLIKSNNQFFAATFGHSYYKINLCADKKWAFEFAQRVDYSSIKSMEVNIPNSMINKRINSYINYSTFEINSGESLSRIDAHLNIGNKIDEKISDRIHIGNSLKFNLSENNLKNIASTIDYINFIIDKKDIKNKIPRFTQIQDSEKIDEYERFLEAELKSNFKNNGELYQIDFNNYLTNYDLVLSDYDKFIIQLNENQKTINSLEIELISNFISSNDDSDVLNNLSISIQELDNAAFNFKDLIFFDYFDEKIVLVEGVWYEYNEDYLEYLEDSMNELKIDYIKEYSFYNPKFFEFIKKRYKDDLERKITCGYDEFYENEYGFVKEYFIEDNFNKFLETQGFINLDKDTENDSNHKIEIADLYKDGTIYAVKIGNAASSLSYVVDQSLIGLKYIHEGRTKKVKRESLTNVCIWLILVRDTKINSLNDLNIIILKNKLDYWKKQVRLLGYNPLIRINYKSKNKNL